MSSASSTENVAGWAGAVGAAPRSWLATGESDARTDGRHTPTHRSEASVEAIQKGWERANPEGARVAEQGLPKGKHGLPKGGCSGCAALSALAVWKAVVAVWKALWSGRRRTGRGRRWPGIGCGTWGVRLIYRRLQQLSRILRKQIGYGITLP